MLKYGFEGRPPGCVLKISSLNFSRASNKFGKDSSSASILAIKDSLEFLFFFDWRIQGRSAILINGLDG